MANVTTCSACGAIYEESSEEAANHPNRLCSRCWQDRGREYRLRSVAAACRTCGAEIVWLRTASGKNMPVDAVTWEPGDETFEPKRHVSHFATRPQAQQHRRAR
jgi:hypothetical protein